MDHRDIKTIRHKSELMPDKPSAEEIPEDLKADYKHSLQRAPISGGEFFAWPNSKITKFIERIAHLEQALRESREEVERLQQWKREQLAVEAEWDAQAVGKELGIEWGASIRKNILPAILKLKAELSKPVTREEELGVRRLLWLMHGHDGLYGDDGEMQCSKCAKYGAWDYLREPLLKLNSVVELVRFELHHARQPKASQPVTDAELKQALDKPWWGYGPLVNDIKSREVRVLRETIRIICADAWPNQPQWPELYEKRARNNIQVEDYKAKEANDADQKGI